MSELGKHFNQYRNNIVGIDKYIETPYGKKKLANFRILDTSLRQKNINIVYQAITLKKY